MSTPHKMDDVWTRKTFFHYIYVPYLPIMVSYILTIHPSICIDYLPTIHPYLLNIYQLSIHMYWLFIDQYFIFTDKISPKFFLNSRKKWFWRFSISKLKGKRVKISRSMYLITLCSQKYGRMKKNLYFISG